MIRSLFTAAVIATAAPIAPAVVTPVPITPAPLAPTAVLPSGSTGGGALTGPMASYAWFPGRWACRTALMSAPTKEPAPGRLYVTADTVKNSVNEIFTSTTPDGKTYRSDGILKYDAAKKLYERNTVDRNGTQIALIAPGPFSAKMVYGGYVGLQDRKVYRMRAAIAYDVTQSQMTTTTSFWDKTTKTWPVQTTTVCSKIDQ